MTGPIKPPGGGPLGVGGAPPGSESPRVGGFEEALDRVTAPKADSIAPTPLAGARATAADLRAGRLDAAAAVERIVAEALSGPMVAGLTPSAKAELEAHLRSQLAEDPSLRAMIEDLDRRD